jgi:hypothetical protein
MTKAKDWEVVYRKGGLTVRRSPHIRGENSRVHVSAHWEYETDFSLGSLMEIGVDFLEASKDLARMVTRNERLEKLNHERTKS